MHVEHAEDQDKPVKAHCRFCGRIVNPMNKIPVITLGIAQQAGCLLVKTATLPPTDRLHVGSMRHSALQSCVRPASVACHDMQSVPTCRPPHKLSMTRADW